LLPTHGDSAEKENPHYISDKFPQFIKECGTLSTFINSDIDK